MQRLFWRARVVGVGVGGVISGCANMLMCGVLCGVGGCGGVWRGVCSGLGCVVCAGEMCGLGFRCALLETK